MTASATALARHQETLIADVYSKSVAPVPRISAVRLLPVRQQPSPCKRDKVSRVPGADVARFLRKVGKKDQLVAVARAEGNGAVLWLAPVEEPEEISEEERFAEETAKVRKRCDRIRPTMRAIVSK